MFGVIFKTLNTKFSKTIINGQTKLSQNSLKDDPFHSVIPQNYLKIHKNLQSIPKNIKKQQSSILTQSLNDLLPEQIFIPGLFIQRQQSFLSSLNYKKQRSPQLQNLNNLVTMSKVNQVQFEANHTIQDRIMCKKLSSINALCLNVFDGHGGDSLADYAAKKIVELIDSFLKTQLEDLNRGKKEQLTINNAQNLIKQAIQWVYEQIETNFFEILDSQFKTGNKSILKVGSCAITVIVYENLIITANLGDSQAVIITENKDHQFDYLVCNEQLSVKNESQRQRLIQQFKDKDSSILIKTKNDKLYLKGYLQPTRTLGDYYLKKQEYYNKLSSGNCKLPPFKGPYISHKPEFNTIKIKQSFRYLIIGSDGLWDFMKKQQVLDILGKNKNDNEDDMISDDEDEEISFKELNRSYNKIQVKKKMKIKLHERLKERVLINCATSKGMSVQQLKQLKPGQRRQYCDDLSIITVDFRDAD